MLFLLAQPLAIRCISPISAYATLDLNIWHACLLIITQAEGSSLFELVETTMATGFQLSSERYFELIGVQQRAARMIERLDTPP